MRGECDGVRVRVCGKIVSKKGGRNVPACELDRIGGEAGWMGVER